MLTHFAAHKTEIKDQHAGENSYPLIKFFSGRGREANWLTYKP